jgi:hypothetical protein
MLPEPLSHAILGSPTDRLAQGIAAAFRDIPAACLPLQGCCHRGGAIVDGCNCSDDPVGYPMCCRMQLRLRIDRTTARGRLEVLDR